MIPVKLALRNFMPYRDNVPPINFSAIHTASIWGDNGNGKSALIDAMTWALWGKTRAKSDDDIIHLGENETQVEFDFKVGEQVYRVIRKHARPRRQRGSGQSSLDLLSAISSTEWKDEFKPITGNTIRETEQKIKDILRMDYDTFVNSAYLRQGHADEFTIASPGDRKKVLANILGLSLYDDLEEQAREMVKKQENEKQLTERAIRDNKDELVQKPAFEDGLVKAQTELAGLEKFVAAGESKLKELRSFKEGLDSKQQQLDQLEKHLAETNRSLASWNDQIKQHQVRIREYQELISRRAGIEEGHARLAETRKLNDDMNRKLTLVRGLEKRKNELERTIERAQSALVTEHKVAENKAGEFETTSQKLPQFKSELQQAQAAFNQLAAEEEQLKQKRQAEQNLLTLVHSLEIDRTRLSTELTEIDEKLGLLAAQTGAVCPLCERELGEEHRKLILTKYASDKKQKTAGLESKQIEFVQKQAEIKAISAEIPRLETKLNHSRTTAQNRITLLEREISEAEKASGQAAEMKTRLGEIEEHLARKDFAAAEQQVLAKLEGELAGLDYDSQQHEQVRQQLSGFEQWEDPKRKLEDADRLFDQEQEAEARCQQETGELNRSLEKDNQKKLALKEELAALPQFTADLTKTEGEQRDLSARQRQTQELLGGLKSKLEHLAQLEVRVKEKEKALNQASKEEGIYRELTRTFGRNGIQAWLIEMALPEFEVEANKLLGRMTDNRMSVKIETQRQTKAGETAETLDIKIADELGTRNYEMFSGGEAFRINFAIRIALSRLLARRAGAPLPTLIIDEGFGTQDVTGLEKLKEAIISIQDDFKMILVITHVEELRDAFPTRIEVTKTAEGSIIEVS